MKNVWRFIAIGVVVYLFVLAATFPASRLVPALERQVEGLDLQAATASLLSGHAGRLVWQGVDRPLDSGGRAFEVAKVCQANDTTQND